MIPKYLKIKGLYSYQKEQEINFDALTDASLFGIFGAVGSGKSSILEAITFALYGDTERLNRSGDDRTYNMMNLRSDELLIDFECVAGKNGDRYRFTVRGKRNAKNFKDVKTFERRAYIWQNEMWIPLGEQETVEQIIGLSYDNFRRTIIIPQGRFQEFIELKDAERTKMMKELFQLEKYDLSRNVGSLSKQNDLELSNLDGQLLGLGEVTAEMIGAEEKQRDAVKQQIKSIQEELLIQTDKESQLQKLKLAFEKIQLLQGQLSVLEGNQAGMAIREEALRTFEVCSIHFKTFIEQKKSLTASLHRDELTFDKNARRITELTNISVKQKEVLTILEPQYLKREELMETARELEKVIGIKDNVQQAEKKRDALKRGEGVLQEKEEVILLLKKQKAEKEAETEQKKALLSDLNEISLVKSWFATLDEIQANRKSIRQEAEDLQSELTKRRSFIDQQISEANQFFAVEIPPESDTVTVQEHVQSFIESNEAEKESLAKQTLLISTRLALHQYANNLADGEPCPLCGAEHHPSVLHPDHLLSGEIEEKEKQRERLQKAEQSVRQFQTAIQKAFGQIETLEKQKSTIKIRYKETTDRLELHNQDFIWNKFDKNDRSGFDRYFGEVSRNQQEIRDNELLVKKLSVTIEEENAEKEEKIEKPLQGLRDDILRIENTIATLTGQLEKVKPSDFEGIEKPEISDRILKLGNQYQEIITLFEKTEKEIDLVEKEKDMLTGSQATLTAALEVNRQELAQAEKRIDEELTIHGFESEIKVSEILAKQIDTASEKKAIDEFKIVLTNTKRDLENLKLENSEQSYDLENHQAILELKESLTLSLNTQRKEEGRLEGLLKKMTADLARKALLLTEKDRLLLRKSHLDDLARLFRSSGFVDYASSIYLQNLIQAANHRFHQMTHQRLHLELGDGNSFWVRDLLNGGHMRLLKTLSGGQKFQAALSLALALADHIHVRNQSVHNFFFLDEGFGSLDKNALQTVFETLKSLRKENRIVGIISHVEDLQQEIQTYLKIEESEEGSKIIASWH
jgi:DNA repair protein SbcC/Rad50